MSEILIYITPENQAQVEIKFDGNTLWATQKEMSQLFETTPQNITIHLKNLYSESEIELTSTCKEDLQVRKEGTRTVERKQLLYNLDAILSVGYRVNSKRGTQFRQWATQTLKDYLIKGQALNQKRLKELDQIVNVIQKAGTSDNTQLLEAKGLLDILGSYTRSFILLNQYDSNSLKTENLNKSLTYEISYEEARIAISELKGQLIAKKEATELFGNEKDESFQGTLQNIIQTFDGQYLYPSIEEQAAHLLYFIIKNHPFTDGNKRIGAFLFIWFLEKNKHRFKATGELKINDIALTALALLVAQCDPSEKELMVSLICNLIADS